MGFFLSILHPRYEFFVCLISHSNSISLGKEIWIFTLNSGQHQDRNDTLIAGVFQLEYESIFKKDFFFSTSHKSRHSLAIIFIIVETTNCLVSKIATTTNWSKTKFNCPHPAPATAQKPKSRDGNLSVFA